MKTLPNVPSLCPDCRKNHGVWTYLGLVNHKHILKCEVCGNKITTDRANYVRQPKANMQQSTTVRFMRGRKLPGYESSIKDIIIRGDKRIVQMDDGTKEVLSKVNLKKVFHKVLQKQQYEAAVRSVQPMRGKQVVAQVGGLKKGEMRIYASEKVAVNALKRRYKIV